MWHVVTPAEREGLVPLAVQIEVGTQIRYLPDEPCSGEVVRVCDGLAYVHWHSDPPERAFPYSVHSIQSCIRCGVWQVWEGKTDA